MVECDLHQSMQGPEVLYGNTALKSMRLMLEQFHYENGRHPVPCEIVW